jgi:tetratricopeptide (TPR) repeat protein
MRHLQLLLSAATILAFLSGCATSGPSQPPSPATEARVAELVRRELLLEQSNFWESALDTNLEILKLEPGNATVMNVIAGVHGTLSEFAEEVNWARKALAIDPRFELAYINLGNGLTGLERFEEARAAYEKAGELAPRDPIPVYSLGVLAENQGKFEQALGFYERSVALDERFESGFYNMAAMLGNLKRFDEAIAALHRVLALDPGRQDAQEMLRLIEAAKARPPG